jgi:sulfoxide reductase heme-binding subunit YedZ
VPALYLLYASTYVGLGAQPIIEALHFIGRWTLWFLLMSLAITPARRLFDWGKLIQIRRILGLTALCYILLHFSLYIVDDGYDLGFVVSEIAQRIYLTIGITAIFGFILLGVTSTDDIIRRMGAVAWNRSHRIVYVVGFLGFLHYYMQAKADVTEPVLYSGLFFWLMEYRIMAKLGWKQGLVPLVILSVVAALTTAFVEAAWYQLLRPGIGARVIFANFDFRLGLRPAWWVLIAGLSVSVASEVWLRLKAWWAPRPQRPVRPVPPPKPASA